MSSFLSSIISAALPVAKIAAQVLPQLLQNLEEPGPGVAPGPVPPISNTLMDFVGDEGAQEVYGVNNTGRTLAVSLQNNVDIGGSIGVQSELFELKARNATPMRRDLATYSDSGWISANYAEPSPEVGGPGMRLAMLSLPFVSALTFTAFGGKIGFERSTVEEGGKRFDRWMLSSENTLQSVTFDYKTQNGQEIHFKADLKKSGRLTHGPSGQTHVYYVNTDGVGLTTGMLTNFNATVESDAVAFAALLSKRELVSFEQLPAHVRSRLRCA